MAEEIAYKFARTMKKGFVNIFVLLVLNQESTHGYHIKKLIEQRTLGVWSLTDSTLYTVLKDLRDKKLIQIKEYQHPDKKVYELTKKGKETLDLLLQRESEMRESMKTIIFSTSDVSEEFLEGGLPELILRGPTVKRPFMGPYSDEFLGHLGNKSKKEQLEILKIQRIFVSKQIEYLNQRLTDIENKISELI